MECLLCVWHCAKHVTSINSLNMYHNPIGWVLSSFMDEEMETWSRYVSCPSSGRASGASIEIVLVSLCLSMARREASPLGQPLCLLVLTLVYLASSIRWELNNFLNCLIGFNPSLWRSSTPSLFFILRPCRRIPSLDFSQFAVIFINLFICYNVGFIR